MKTAAVKRGKQLLDFTQYDFSGGINITDSFEQMSDKDMRACTNGYLSTDGNIIQRLGANPSGPVCGTGPGSNIYRFFQELYHGAVVSRSITLEQVGGTLYNADDGTMIGTLNQLGADAQPMSVAKVLDPAHSGGATEILVICTGDGGPYAYDGVALTTLTTGPTTITDPRWCIQINNQLFFGGLSNQPNLVVGSVAGQPESQPGYATFEVSLPVTGLGAVGIGAQAALVVGMTLGVTLIQGFTPNSYFEQEIHSDQDGPVAGRTMISADGYCYFLGNMAIYRFDGSSYVEISRKVRKWILNDPTEPAFPMNGNRQLSWAFAYERRIYFFYDSGNVGYTNVALVWDLDRQGWTIYNGIPFSGAALANAPGDVSPWQAVAVSALSGQQFQFEAYLDDNFNVADDGAPVPTDILTKYFKIGGAIVSKTLMRTYLELLLQSNLNGNLAIATDYGGSTTIPFSFESTAPSALWDDGTWDLDDWQAVSWQRLQKRYDMNIQGEAFAFELTTNSISPPWQLMGLAGRVSVMPRN